MSLICNIFGHKFFYNTFEKTGEIKGISGIAVDVGVTYRHETTYCTRCGKLHDAAKAFNDFTIKTAQKKENNI